MQGGWRHADSGATASSRPDSKNTEIDELAHPGGGEAQPAPFLVSARALRLQRRQGLVFPARPHMAPQEEQATRRATSPDFGLF